MTRASLREYAAVQRERYLGATRAEKRQLLNEVVAGAGIHRKAAIRLLRRAPRPPAAPSRAGRPRVYGLEVARAAAVLWQASGRIGAHRLQPFVPELLDRPKTFSFNLPCKGLAQLLPIPGRLPTPDLEAEGNGSRRGRLSRRPR